MAKTIAIAGAGDVAKYVVEELRKEGKHKVVILSRAV
jgi:glutamate dehydrogenase/leucine dehydrogenase